MTTSDDHPYQIGRGRPPLHTRFKPGQSGNPSGRPKRRQSFKRDIADSLDAAMPNADGDMTKQKKFADNLVDDALARDPLAIKIVAPIALALDGNEADHDEQPSPEEQKLIEDFNRREESVSTTQDGGDDDA
jgi:hypothetical protein